MRRILIVLGACCALVAPAQVFTGSLSFGLSLQSFSAARFIPFPVGQIGYDFGSASEGFSLEASLLPLIIINHIGAQGFYRIPVLENGSKYLLNEFHTSTAFNASNATSTAARNSTTES